MIGSAGVVVPAHDEEELLPGCLAALREAAAVAEAVRSGLRVRIVVTADACSDGTAALARQAGATVVTVSARNVGTARAVGLRKVLRQETGPRHEPGQSLAGPRQALAGPGAGLWLATTDADSLVPPDWLSRQLRYADAGGFPPLRTGEDHALVATLRAQGRRVLRTSLVTVVTSARNTHRGPAGFGRRLTTLGGGTDSLLDAS